MRERARAVPTQTRGGLIVAQWYVDAFYDALDDLPDPAGPAFTAAVEEIEERTQAAVNEALAELRETLARRGIRLEVAER